MEPMTGCERVQFFLNETRDIAVAVKASRPTVPLANGCQPDKMIGRVAYFCFRKMNWVPKSIPLKQPHQGKDAQEGFLHWMGLRSYQVVGGVFRYLICQGFQQFRQAEQEIFDLYHHKREYLNPLIRDNPKDERFLTAEIIYLKRRDLFKALQREGAYKCAMGVAAVAAVLFLGLGALTYQPIFFRASLVCSLGFFSGLGYFCLRKAPFLPIAEEILSKKVTVYESRDNDSRSTSTSSEPDSRPSPPSFDRPSYPDPAAMTEKPVPPATTGQPQRYTVLGDLSQSSSDGSFERL